MNNPPPAPTGLATAHVVGDQSQQVVEAASPISSRPPAPNLDEFLPLSAGCLPPDDGDEADRAGGSSGGGGGNRWPRQETLALLRIRSEMDATFRDASLKGPLWEDVSRKLAELGYKRSAKKCKEKFENVHKYYKRTKEGRAGRQDGKSYKFFTELEALHGVTTTPNATVSRPVIASPPPSTTNASQTNFIVSPSPAPPPPSVSINPMPISSIRFPPNSFASPTPLSQPPPLISPAFQTGSAVNPGGATSISTNSTSTSPMTEDDEDEDYDLQGDPGNAGSSRKRKRSGKGGGGGGTRRMMDFFEGLMKQVMQKQEVMQQRFLEAVEKREQDRMIREEAWKRQEMARLSRDQELAAQERAISASRDAAIISFLQKITGQTIQFPAAAPPPPPSPAPAPPPPPQQQHHQHDLHQHHHQQSQQQQPVHQQKRQTQGPTEVVRPQQTDVVMAVPEQQVAPQEPSSGGGGSGSFETVSSRWPKAEVLALINLRSGLETRYQEVGPKGPLWEEISSGMKRLGYNRSSKRCKEKWENINKYFKKVKESSKKRPEDAKTCPYFHQLDALYRRKVLISTSGGTSNLSQQESVKSDTVAKKQTEEENRNGGRSESNVAMAANLFGETTAKKPEDIVKELMAQQQLMVDDYDKVEEGESDEMEEEDDDDEELEEERKMDYKIEFQRQNNTGPSNGGGNGAPSFLAMVQ